LAESIAKGSIFHAMYFVLLLLLLLLSIYKSSRVRPLVHMLGIQPYYWWAVQSH